MPEQLTAIAIVPLIVGLVEAGKHLGLDARWAAPLAVALGLAISLASYAVGDCRLEAGASLQLAMASLHPATASLAPPGCQSLLDATLLGLALGLSAAGLYSGAKKALAA